MKFSLTFSWSARAWALSACGGGGGGSATDAGVTAGAIDKYVGTWVTGCSQFGSSITDATTNNPAYTSGELQITRQTATTASYKSTILVYPSTDTTCSTASIGSIVVTGENTGSFSAGSSGITSSHGANTLSVDGEATLADGKKVDKMTTKEAALAPNAPGTYTVGTGNRFKVVTQSFTGGETKAIVWAETATRIKMEATETSYPTAFTSDAVVLTKK